MKIERIALGLSIFAFAVSVSRFVCVVSGKVPVAHEDPICGHFRNPVVLSDEYRQTDDYEEWVKHPVEYRERTGYYSPVEHFRKLNALMLRSHGCDYK